MIYEIHKATARGYANHGWLETSHSFSFASYYDPEKIHFGALRVLNDDKIEAGYGFPTHPHNNMEIITIPLSGSLAHKDSMGNGTIIQTGDVQVMSAGTGIQHSEYNASETEACELFQIWIFPNQKDVVPRYDQYTYKDDFKVNAWNQILSPHNDDTGVWIHQQAWMNLAEFDSDQQTSYALHDANKNGIYLLVVEGEVEFEGEKLGKRDACALFDLQELNLTVKNKSKVLVIEVPLAI
jgi:redox-sensitive bicupin YhaK (pirin superfamily)